MKRLLHVAILVLIASLFPVLAFADDTEVFGSVRPAVEPNLLFIVDNSISMERVEGNLPGTYSPVTEYFGKYDEDKFYYYKLDDPNFLGRRDIEKDLVPLTPDDIISGKDDISKIKCQDMKNALSYSSGAPGFWAGQVTLVTKNGEYGYECSGVQETECKENGKKGTSQTMSFFSGNYLNWMYFKIDEEYDSTKTYFGIFNGSKYYKATGAMYGRPKPETFPIYNAPINMLQDGNVLKDRLLSSGFYDAKLDDTIRLGDNGKYYDRNHSALLLGEKIIVYNYAAYTGNYLNWFFQRTTSSYDRNTNYSGYFDNTQFYYCSHNEVLDSKKDPVARDYASGIDQVSQNNNFDCLKIKTDLDSKGFWNGSVCIFGNNNSESYKCKDENIVSLDRIFYSGRYLNWYYERRIDKAKRAMLRSITEERNGQSQLRDDLKLGLMTLNDYQTAESGFWNIRPGAHIASPVQDDTNAFKARVREIHTISKPQSALAASLAEAGLYYAGLESRVSPELPPYQSPITNYCQRNHVVLISDGSSFLDLMDLNINFFSINSTYIGKSIVDGIGRRARAPYLDEIALFLRRNDVYFPDDPRFGSTPHPQNETVQYVTTHTIGFKPNTLLDYFDSNMNLLVKTAEDGGGTFSATDSVETLEASIRAVMNRITKVTAAFNTVSVPASSDNKSYSGDYAYMTMFYPFSDAGRWIGNLKKYKIVNGLTSTALDSKDEWGQETGREVMDGGARKLLAQRDAERKIFTNVGDNKTLIEFKTNTITDEQKRQNNLTDSVIDNIRNGGVPIVDQDGNRENGVYVLGDIIHSNPVIMKYDATTGSGQSSSSSKRVFVGANDGMLHCFNDASGEEEWAYVPGPQLRRLKNLVVPPVNANDTDRRNFYSVDGGITSYVDGDKKLLIFGERRGGNNYYILNVSSINNPVLEQVVTPSSNAGQSWSVPKIVKMAQSVGEPRKVFWVGGGYDSNNQDKPTIREPNSSPNSSDDKGKGVYAIDISNGQVVKSFEDGRMENSIISPVSFSPTGLDDPHTRVYACDIGGTMWGFRQDSDRIPEGTSMHLPGTVNSDWSTFKLFNTGVKKRKVFHRPEVVLETFTRVVEKNGKLENHLYQGEMVFWGTGDREHPSSIPSGNAPDDQDRFYGLMNSWDVQNTIDESSLIDVTSYDYYQLNKDTMNKLKSTSGRGWSIRLENPGEKVVSSPVAFRGIVFFATYTPESGTAPASNTDPCSGLGAFGTARLYALNYMTGEATIDFDKTKGRNQEGYEVADASLKELCKSDRSVVLGSGMPGSPSLLFPKEGGTRIMVGIGNDIRVIDLNLRDMTVYYWKEKQ